MDNRKNQRKEPWRIVIFIISVLFIAFMWSTRDISDIYATTPRDQAVPLIATTIFVSLIKISVITGGVWLIKWVSGKIRKK